MWAACSEESKSMLEAYTLGVNAWLAQWRTGDPNAQLSDEYNFAIFDIAGSRRYFGSIGVPSCPFEDPKIRRCKNHMKFIAIPEDQQL